MSIMELRKKSQVTIPKDVIRKLKLHEGDKFEITEKNGVIYMIPVSIYPKKYVEELEKIAAQTKHGIEDGSIPVFDNVDDMFNSLDED
ncbi:MAG: AbrB/MazE/SpoVT family DNA-binding domain-containing protein [Monoglobales bacterium]|jgi:AbrB family looped-hinge helix DNA binding protein